MDGRRTDWTLTNWVMMAEIGRNVGQNDAGENWSNGYRSIKSAGCEGVGLLGTGRIGL